MAGKFLGVVLAALLAMPAAAETDAAVRIRCASTTSTQNSGLFDYLLPRFQEKTGIRVDVVAVGTGAALEIGKRGDADVVLVHAREEELQAVAAGHFVERRELMYNDFVLVGPPLDPGKIKGTASAVEALGRIAAGSHAFVSRGDKSGTHAREMDLWRRVGIDPRGRQWYLEVGQGMEKTQRIAHEKRAYTLTDRGTWLATRDQDRLEMAVVLEGDPLLFNQYGVMAVNPQRHPRVKYREALQFIHWLTSPEGQAAIGAYRDQHGNQLFVPNAAAVLGR